jgi:DMSO/TMAO reductase YedYZ heme-binding membrane subunit
MTRTKQGLVFLFGSILVATLVTSWAGGGGSEESVRRSLLWTGRLAFVVFLIPLTASPLRKLIRNDLTSRLVRWRRNAGIAYGGIQVVHLLLIAGLFYLSTTPPVDTPTLVVGGTAIVLVMFMLATSFDLPARLLGAKRWRLLHRSGLYICTFIYLYDFVIGPLETGQLLHYLPWATLILLAIGARVLALTASRRTAANASTA